MFNPRLQLWIDLISLSYCFCSIELPINLFLKQIFDSRQEVKAESPSRIRKIIIEILQFKQIFCKIKFKDERLNFVFRIKFVTNQGHYLSIYLSTNSYIYGGRQYGAEIRGFEFYYVCKKTLIQQFYNLQTFTLPFHLTYHFFIHHLVVTARDT